jgi:hypothetical protein
MPTVRMEEMFRALTKMNFYTAIHLPTVFFPPGENAVLAVSAAHEHFDLFTVHALRLGSISYSVGIFEVDTVLVKEMHSLLLVI